jgi:hypothetical protein
MADIQLSDCQLMMQIIELSSKHGSFSAADLEHIGKLYNKLNEIIKHYKSLEENVDVN